MLRDWAVVRGRPLGGGWPERWRIEVTQGREGGRPMWTVRATFEAIERPAVYAPNGGTWPPTDVLIDGEVSCGEQMFRSLGRAREAACNLMTLLGGVQWLECVETASVSPDLVRTAQRMIARRRPWEHGPPEPPTPCPEHRAEHVAYSLEGVPVRLDP